MRDMLARLAVMLGALLWGTLAIFVKKLTYYGFTEMEIVTIRVTGAFICFIPIAIAANSKGQMQVQLRHIWYFIGTGLFSIAFFNWAYFTAMNMMSISIAVMLLYTGPAFVVVLSNLFLKERLTGKKLAAVLMTVTGCAVIALSGDNSSGNWTLLGFVIGLCSGLGYALYSIFSKLALRKYNSMTITLYTFLIASICLLPFFPFWKKTFGLPLEGWLYIVGLGLIPTVIAYLLYTTGLSKVETSTASILATVEPVAAVIIGILLFHEQLYGGQLAGASMIVSSILIISYERKTKKELFL
ncbi:EamA family transporter [Siminovitchia terrae]|uniref:EamA family transporter n=2 Tax=Siminovitchia terrae TaxID=1914933 RepID=A0A429X4J5_SIMTE|nr:EamA family transporter [Siminovitchia terrae]